MEARQQADALHRSGVAAFQAGRSADAIDLIRRAIQLDPTRADFRSNLGLILSDSDPAGAITLFREAIALQPDLALVHKNLAMMLYERGFIDESINEFGRALELGVDVVGELNELALAMRHAGQVERSLACYDKILAARPDNAIVAGERCYLLQLIPRFDAQAILREHIAWDRGFAQLLKKEIQPHENNRDPNRRLRIGYVSPDFKNHCQQYFTLPLFSRHDHKAFEIYLYSSVSNPDDVTVRLKNYADTWREVAGQSDQNVAKLVREDRIDILVDLTMHMPQGRPLLFARKPAPLQIAWLAYPGTMGMEAIDVRLTDPYLDPPSQTDGNYSEKSLRLPHTFWCFDLDRAGPTVHALPALKNGFITFGCLNNFGKVNESVLALWAKVLAKLPNSRLALLLDDADRQKWVATQLGVDPSRLEFVPIQGHHDYLRTYNRIDLGLDTLPYNGHTTSLDSFWMGVPVVSLVGKTVVGRAGWSQLNNLKLSELAAFSEADFVRIAVELATDLPRLAEIRRTLRDRILKSPLMDADQFTRDLEAVYRRLWRQWVGAHAAR
jgi:protein O-GlcNAc transferase